MHPEDTCPKSRRSFMLAGALAALSFLPRRAAAQITRRPPRGKGIRATVGPDVAAIAPSTWDTSVLRLARRATLGVSAADVATARQMGYQGWLNWQVNHTRIDDSAVDGVVAQRWPLLAQSSDQIYQQSLGTLIANLQEATLYRQAFSRRQLYERMVEFWSDHFNIAMTDVGYLKVADDRDVIRRHALGRFPDLLRASSRSAAMLAYLDQNLSRAGRPNQNYAREVMELHTLGVDGGYTQDDVAELSRVLTGWTIRGRGDFYFDPTIHDWGAKTVLGVTIPAGSPSMGADGIKEGEQLLTMLANHPSTARFIATKMLKWLLTPTPSDTQVRTVAAVYRATGGDIKAMVRAILNEGWLTAAPAKFKRPSHFLVSAIRGTGATVGPNGLARYLPQMGHQLFQWETPDGFPDRMEFWVGNILSRWNVAIGVSTANSTTLSVDVNSFLKGTPDGTVQEIDNRMFGGEMPATTRTALLNYLRGGTYGADRVRETIGLALSSADFQWY